jgi:hypothetical protein
MSEQEKLQAQIAERDTKFAELQQQYEQDKARFDADRIKAAVKLAAQNAGFADPADAFNLADRTKVEIDPESGEIKGVEDALKKLSEAKPYLLTKNVRGDGLGNNTRGNRRGTQPPPDDKKLKVPPVRL